MIDSKNSVLKFKYSYPYEASLLILAGQKPTEAHHKEGYKKCKYVQKLWNKYEDEIFKLFSEIYKIKIPDKDIRVYISLISVNSFSDPFTISLKWRKKIETDNISKRGFVYNVIHELAHYFLYTRNDKEFANKLYHKLQKKNILGSHGANLHYLIQAVEFGIIGEVFGKEYADFYRNWVIKKWPENEYGKSAKKLKGNNIPTDKTCLKFIAKKVV